MHAADFVVAVFGVVIAAVVVRRIVQIANDKRAIRKLVPELVVAACLWWPFSWLLLMEYAWNDYRLSWLKMWPLLPGLFPGMWLFHPTHELLEFGTMAVVTLALWLGLTWLGKRGGAGLAAAAVLALASSIPTACIAYAVFRA